MRANATSFGGVRGKKGGYPPPPPTLSSTRSRRPTPAHTNWSVQRGRVGEYIHTLPLMPHAPPRCARPPLVPPCSTRGGFPLPLRVGLPPPRLGTQTGKQSDARKVCPSPSFGAPDDSHKTGSTETCATPLTPASVTEYDRRGPSPVSAPPLPPFARPNGVHTKQGPHGNGAPALCAPSSPMGSFAEER